MARQRAVKQRLDLRKGGRVRAVRGLSPAERRKLLEQDPIPGDPDYVAPTTPATTIADRAATVATTTEPDAGDFGRQPGEYPDAGTTNTTAQDTATDTATDTDIATDTATTTNNQGLSATTDRGFGERTTTATDPITINVASGDPTIAGDTFQMESIGPTAAPEDVTAQQITSAQGTAAQAAQQEDIQAAQMTAERAGKLGEVQAATRQVTREAEAEGPTLTERAVAAERDTTQEAQALAQAQDLEVSQDAFVKEVVGKTTEVVQTTAAEKNQREAVLGMPPPDGEEAKIINKFGFGASKNRTLKGNAAKEAASNRLVDQHGITKEVADSILEDVGQLVTDIDGVPQEALGAVAELPKEALVSSQMESLLAGMEEGKVPSWARAAVAGVEQRLAERGLTASTVGRDALFNAIVQSTLPIAQSNATALQQRAAQNLTNEQQALIQDRQIAADFLSKNAAFKQQMELANLSNEQQITLANLTALNQAGSENLSAAQQTDLANLNSLMATNQLTAKLAAEMGLAQLNVDQQTAIQNASLVANIDFTKFNTAQQTELANSKFMQTMTVASFNANQQTALQNATTLAQMDLATADQNTKLAIENARNFLSMDMSNLSNEQQANLLSSQLEQQRLLSDQSAANAAAQFNAASENQTEQFMTGLAQNVELANTASINQMETLNVTEENRIAQVNAGNDLAADQFNSQAQTAVAMFDQEVEFKKEQWNAQNAQVVEQATVEWERKTNTLETAAANEANKLAAQFTFNMDQSEQNFLWQEMRDDAAFAQQTAESLKERALSLLNTIYGSSTLMEAKGANYARDTLAPILEKLVGLL